MKYHFMEHIQHRKISHSAKSTKTLTDDAPFALLLGIIRCQASTDSFTIADDIVCPEVLHVLGLLDCISLSGQSACGNSRAETSATLVQEQDLYPNTKVSAQISSPEIYYKIPIPGSLCRELSQPSRYPAGHDIQTPGHPGDKPTRAIAYCHFRSSRAQRGFPGDKHYAQRVSSCHFLGCCSQQGHRRIALPHEAFLQQT